MRIGFDAKRAFLNSSGLGNYSRTTINALKQYHPENHYVLFTPEINIDLFPNYREYDVISPDSSLSKIFRSLWRSFSLSRQLEKHELDIFHGLSNELPEGMHKYDVPAVVTVHDLIFMRHPEFYKPIDRNIYYKKVKYACNSANKILTISNQTKQDLIQYLHIDPEKAEVMYQSISPVYFENQNTDELIGKYQLPEKFILSVGTIERRKNQLSLLMALHLAGISLPVVFVGKQTNYSIELIRYINENNMKKQVKFLSDIPEKDLAGLYNRAVLSVYISLFEGFGLPIIESMASGCPVITSTLSCLPETAGGAALLCDPHNQKELGYQIEHILGNNAYRNELILKGRERAKDFHPKQYSEKMISLYSEIVS